MTPTAREKILLDALEDAREWARGNDEWALEGRLKKQLAKFQALPEEQRGEVRKAFEAGYNAFCTKHWTLDEAWADFSSAKLSAIKEK